MSDALKKLAQSALAIPGMVGVANAAGPAESEASYRYSYYTEDDSPASRDDSGGAQERYTIQVHQFHLLQPVSDKLAVTVEGSYEHMSGASPVYSYVPDGEEEVVTHFNGASKEARFDLTASGRMYQSLSDFGAGVYGSKERDYTAVSGFLDGAVQINDQMTTLSGGISGGYDWIDPNSGILDASDEALMVSELSDTQKAELAASNPARFNAAGKTKWQVSVFEGVGQVINMNTVVQASASVTVKNGYLSDPYRDCVGSNDPIADNVPCDIRPSNRVMGTASAGLRHFLPNLNSAVHVDYRFFADSWDIASHTVDVAYYQNWAPSWSFFTNNNVNFQLTPSLRYYQQSAAFFYEVPDLNEASGWVYSVDTTKYYSSDPRLSQYGAVSFKTQLKIDIRQFALLARAERYVSNPSLGFNDEETPGLPSFWRYSTGLDFRF